MRAFHGTTRFVAGIAGLAVAASLTGCGVDKLAEEGIEKGIEEAIEQGASEDIELDIDEDGGKVSIEGKDGSMEFGSSELPEGFPTDAVPLVDGEIITSSHFAQGEEEIWSVALRLPDGASFDDAAAALADAGFEEVQTMESNGFSSATYHSDEYRVSVATIEDGDELGVSYSVATLSSE